MKMKRIAGGLLLAALSACKGECSCDVDDDDGAGTGGTDAVATTSSGVTSNTSTGEGGGTTTGEGGAGASGTGGAGQGGATIGTGGSGGSGQGGSGQGGQGGGGGGGGGQGGAAVAAPECQEAADCQLIDDCCACDAVPITVIPEECPQECFQSSCSALSRPRNAEVACVAGQCVAGFTCDWNVVACDQAPPECGEGTTASVIDGCYGPCVPTAECTSVGSCDQCDGGLACVQREAFGSTFHCVTPEPCDEVDCACLGPGVCGDGFDACSDNGSGLVCSCLDC